MRIPESVALLADLVAVPSPTCEEENAARLLADRLARFGWDSPYLDGMGSVIASRGKGDKELADKFNTAITEIRANGKYKQVQDKYFNFDVYGE